MIQFTDILIGSPLPLHQDLLDYPCLSLRVIADGKVCGETPAMNGDPKTGFWELRSDLHVGRIKVRFAAVTFSVEKLIAGVKRRPHGCHEFLLGRSGSSMQLLLTCSVKLMGLSIAGTYPLQAVTRAKHAPDSSKEEYEETTTLESASAGSGIPSRGQLESFYAIVCRQSQDDRASGLSILGSAYNKLYDESGREADLEKSISMHEAAMQLTSRFHPQVAAHSHRLGIALTDRFGRTGDIADIERAVRLHQDAVSFTDDIDPERPSRLVGFGNALKLRFERFGELSDLEKSILYLQQAVDLRRDDERGNLAALNNLGNSLLIRFEQIGNLADVKDAISSLQKAVELAPDDHPDKGSLLSNLGGALIRRFGRLGTIADLDTAISSLKMAVKFTPDGHPDKPTKFSNLGSALEARFDRLGNLVDIDHAISSLQKAVRLTADVHPDKPSQLSNLGGALQTRFKRLGSLADIDNAIALKQKAVELTLDGHPGKSTQLRNLGNALVLRYERVRTVSDLDIAISGLQKAVKLTPDGHPEKPGLLSALGRAISRRFERFGAIADMDTSLSSLQKAVKLTPDGHPDKPSQLSNLGSALKMRFERLGSLVDIDNAVSSVQMAVELTPDGHPEKPHRFHNHGNVLLARFERFKAPEDLESALQNYSRAATSPAGPAMDRFNAARAWARTTNKYSRSPLSAYRCAIELLPRIAWLGLAVTDQHALLADVGDVVRDAVEAAIRFEECELAVEWAEQGRSIVWQNLLGLRTPLDALRVAYPRLADRLQTVTSQLEASSPPNIVSDGGGQVPIVDVARKSSELATEWENIVEEIRRLPGFEGFLRAKTFTEIAPAASEGPVVILNVHTSRCDALVLIPDESEHRRVSVFNVPLERFSEDTSHKLFQNLKGLLSSAGVRSRDINRKSERYQSQMDTNNKFRTILRILWQDVVKPVIEALAYQVQSDHPPRTWWCATGPLAFLPIHAAGLYGTQEVGESVSDYVISSYTPSLTAILDLSEPTVPKDFQLLTVAQPSTPDATPIPKTDDEVKIVQRLARDVRVVNLTGADATVERVLQGMKESNWIHLACHGQQNTENALDSGFLLHYGTLRLSEIVAVTHSKADFAFLSACETAVGDEKVAEESAHLAAGMLLSGCRGVIATMWSIRDDDGPQIAEDVYSRILKDGRPNRKQAAYALHEAVKRLRESGADFMAWVPFIHIGR